MFDVDDRNDFGDLRVRIRRSARIPATPSAAARANVSRPSGRLIPVRMRICFISPVAPGYPWWCSSQLPQYGPSEKVKIAYLMTYRW